MVLIVIGSFMLIIYIIGCFAAAYVMGLYNICRDNPIPVYRLVTYAVFWPISLTFLVISSNIKTIKDFRK